MQDRSCLNCKRRPAERAGYLTAVTPRGGGPVLSITLSGFECVECSHANARMIFEKFSGSLVSVRQESHILSSSPRWTVEVDWAHYLPLHDRDPRGEECREANEVLLALGVFSLEAEKNWMHFTRQMLPMNPAEHTTTRFYFTTKEYAESYGELAFADDNRWGGLYQIGEVVSLLAKKVLV